LNRRSQTRHDVDIAAHVGRDGQLSACTLRNLSRGGAFAEIGALPHGTAVTLWFELPDGSGAIEVDAVARWSTPDGVGLQFGSLRARDAWALGRYLDAVSKTA
jgi:type IV pilus assembly protein PilZ